MRIVISILIGLFFSRPFCTQRTDKNWLFTHMTVLIRIGGQGPS